MEMSVSKPSYRVSGQLLIAACLLCSETDARCREDQVQECRAAVAANNLMKIPSGGVCTPHKYDIYDQLCTLNFYTGGIDYCCCAHNNKALCCRFHYDHNYFRCDEKADAVSLPLSLTATVAISLAVVFVVVAIIIAIVVKCVRGRRSPLEVTDNPEGTNTPKTNNPDDGAESVREPLNPDERAPSRDIQENNSQVSFADGTRVEPTAPPADELCSPTSYLPRYERVASQPAELHPDRSAQRGSGHELFRSESDNYEERRHLAVMPEPPPAYDEHHEHRLYEPEVNNADRTVSWL